MASVPSPTQIIFAGICVYFVARGWVPLDILPFPILSTIYIYVLSRYVVPPVTSIVEPGLFNGSKLLRNYVLFAAVIGILLPLVYIIWAYVQGDLLAVQEAVPSLFLLILQVMSENYTFAKPSFSILIRPLVAILYNARRVFCNWTWMMFVFGWGASKPEISTGGLAIFGQVLAVANVILWNYNLFGFLVPDFLLRSMRRYFEMEQKAKQ